MSPPALRFKSSLEARRGQPSEAFAEVNVRHAYPTRCWSRHALKPSDTITSRVPTIATIPHWLSSPKTVELLLRPRVALLRCPTIPSNGFHAIPLHASTVLVHPAEIHLSEGGAMVGRAAEPADGLLVISPHPTAVAIHGA